MLTVHSLCVALTLSTLILTQASANEPADKPSRIKATIDKTTATVTAIDYKTRKVTLQDAQGKSMELEIGSEAKNFDKVKQGDEVVIEYIESVAFVVTPKGAPVPASGKTAIVEHAKPGEQPHGKAVKTTTLTVMVEAIDYETRIVRLQDPKGNLRTLKVGPEVKRLDQVRPGDQVTIKVTVATAISVSKPAQ